LGGDELADGAEDSGESWLGGALRFAQAAEQEDAEQHRGLFDDEADAVGGRSRPSGEKWAGSRNIF
jgi:hypothetical protein